MKNWIIYLFPLLLAACSEAPATDAGNTEEENTTETALQGNANCRISGKITGAVHQPLILEVTAEQGTLELGRTQIKEDGSFDLPARINGFGMYQLKLGMGGEKVLPLTIVPEDQIRINTSFEQFELRPSIEGTSWSKCLTGYLAVFNDFGKKQMELSQQQGMSEEEQIAAFLEMRKPVDAYALKNMETDPGNPANMILFTALTPAMGYEYWDKSSLPVLKKVAAAYQKKYSESPVARSIEMQVAEIEKGWEDYQASFSGTVVAPEIALPNPAGKTLKLSSLKGKVVLIDFWASWCGPCRKENPNVVRLYKQYKAKGFEIFSVSLDSDADAWKRAIEADGLIWPNHVSDLKQWNTPLTQIYGFNAIPFTVLVNRNGKIVGKNLRGQKLEQKLKEVL